MTACSSPAQKTNSVYKETTEDTISVAFEETTTNKSEETTTEKTSTTTTQKTESTSKNTTNKSSTTRVADTTKMVTTTKPYTNPSTTNPQTTNPATNLPDYYPETDMIALFNSVNNYRKENDLRPLSLDAEICKLAYIRAQEQELLISHTRPNGKKFSSIFREYNFPYHEYVGENIALIWESPSERPLELWKNSESHNTNMLDPDWVKTGIAVYRNSDGRYNIVQLFASN